MERLSVFVLNSLLLGVGLAMDAFSVSVANGLREPYMTRRRQCAVAGVYALFQAAMPLTGWFFVRTAAERFAWFQRLTPWIGAALLFWIGGRMAAEGLRGPDAEAVTTAAPLGTWELLAQGVATSIDALSVGFAIAGYGPARAVSAAVLIAAVTFVLCAAGVSLGRRAGAVLSGRAPLAGGMILIFIGAELLVRAVLG